MGTLAAGPKLTTVELLDRLVSFDTTSRNSNLPLIGFVRDYLETVPGWGKRPPPPPLPAGVIERTAAKYREALARLTDQQLD